MKKQLFPKEFIRHSIEHYTFRIRGRSQIVYLILLFTIALAIVALPLTYIDVTVLSTGQVDTQEKRFDLYAPLAGFIDSFQMKENQFATKGDTLIRFDASLIRQELAHTNKELKDISDFLSDLELLIDGKGEAEGFSSSRYRLNYLQYSSALDKLEIEKANIAKVYSRQSQLFDQKVIAEAEFELHKAKFEQTKAEIDFFKKQAQNSWKESHISLEEKMEHSILKLDRLITELNKYVLLAPGTGELQQVVTLSDGEFIQSGKKLGQLSPDTTLIAICWIPPRDIGLIQKNMKGSFRIDAFSSNQWGFISGEITGISSDVYLIDNQPLFKVECKLDQSFLTLQNGFVGKLKKGMTFQASFIITKRTLYQLLYDKVDSWLNPSVQSPTQ